MNKHLFGLNAGNYDDDDEDDNTDCGFNNCEESIEDIIFQIAGVSLDLLGSADESKE